MTDSPFPHLEKGDEGHVSEQNLSLVDGGAGSCIGCVRAVRHPVRAAGCRTCSLRLPRQSNAECHLWHYHGVCILGKPGDRDAWNSCRIPWVQLYREQRGDVGGCVLFVLFTKNGSCDIIFLQSSCTQPLWILPWGDEIMKKICKNIQVWKSAVALV